MKLNRSRMRKTQEATMNQFCEIEHYIVAEDGTCSYKAPVMVKCGIKSTSSASKANGSGSLYDTVNADAELRLPVGTTVGARDRVTMTKSFGEALSVRHYEVCAVPADYGPSGIVCLLKEVYS